MLRNKSRTATILVMLLLPVLIVMMASPGVSLPTGTTPTSKPAYYADRLGDSIRPASGPIDLTDSDSMAVHTVDGALRIPYHSICSLSYSSLGVSASGQEGLTYRRLLTVGFYTDSGVHHNLVVQLSSTNAGATLKTITARTGLKLGESPKN